MHFKVSKITFFLHFTLAPAKFGTPFAHYNMYTSKLIQHNFYERNYNTRRQISSKTQTYILNQAGLPGKPASPQQFYGGTFKSSSM